MKFVTPHEAVYRRNMIIAAHAHAKRGPNHVPVMPKSGKENQVVKFIVVNKKK